MRCGIHTNKCQAKALEFVHLCDCKYILGCSVITCHEPMRANLSLKTLKNRRYFRKAMSKKDERLHIPFTCKYLTNEQDEVKCKGCPRRSWLVKVEFLKKDLGLQD